eukprot:s1914_g6.t1
MCKLLRGGPDDRHIFTMVAAELQSVINAQIQEDKSCFGACAWELVSDGVRSQLHGLRDYVLTEDDLADEWADQNSARAHGHLRYAPCLLQRSVMDL